MLLQLFYLVYLRLDFLPCNLHRVNDGILVDSFLQEGANNSLVLQVQMGMTGPIQSMARNQAANCAHRIYVCNQMRCASLSCNSRLECLASLSRCREVV